jgi:tripartite-type tricarboxylate transporter receptor subunit TctC
MELMKTSGQHMAVALIAGVSALATMHVHAQNYPAKPVRLVLPYLGGADFVGRWLSIKISPGLGQQMVVDPRVGAGGNIGHDHVAKSPPDGYTLMMTSPPVVINPHLKKVPYDPLKDFAPIALVASLPNVLAVHPSVPVKSVQELVNLARRSPGKLSYGSGEVGSTSHLSGELFKALSKTNIVLIPYKGATFALVGAMSGEVDVVIPAVSAVASYVKDGRMRALAALDTKRIKSMPDVPTSAEAGMPQFLVVNWYALLAPAGTPRPIIDRLHAETAKVMNSAETKERFTAVGAEPTMTTPEQCLEFLKEEFQRWGKVIRDANIRME